MIKKIDLYIIKKFLGTYVFAIALIISIVVVFDVNEKLDALLKAPLKATVFDYYLNFIPYFVSLFSPLFTFISVIFFLSFKEIGRPFRRTALDICFRRDVRAILHHAFNSL